MLPLLNILAFITGMQGGFIVATTIYNIPPAVFWNSANSFMNIWDLGSSLIKALIFGVLIAIIGSSWGLTTSGGA